MQARRLTSQVRDRVRTAQVDDSRAQVFNAQKRYGAAEAAARNAAISFERAGRQAFLAEALITQGIAVARLRKPERARFIFQRAIEIAHQAGALSRAGLATLTMIEEIEPLPPEILIAAYQQAGVWLADCQSESIRQRLDWPQRSCRTIRRTVKRKRGRASLQQALSVDGRSNEVRAGDNQNYTRPSKREATFRATA